MVLENNTVPGQPFMPRQLLVYRQIGRRYVLLLICNNHQDVIWTFMRLFGSDFAVCLRKRY